MPKQRKKQFCRFCQYFLDSWKKPAYFNAHSRIEGLFQIFLRKIIAKGELFPAALWKVLASLLMTPTIASQFGRSFLRL